MFYSRILICSMLMIFLISADLPHRAFAMEEQELPVNHSTSEVLNQILDYLSKDDVQGAYEYLLKLQPSLSKNRIWDQVLGDIKKLQALDASTQQFQKMKNKISDKLQRAIKKSLDSSQKKPYGLLEKPQKQPSKTLKEESSPGNLKNNTILDILDTTLGYLNKNNANDAYYYLQKLEKSDQLPQITGINWKKILDIISDLAFQNDSAQMDKLIKSLLNVKKAYDTPENNLKIAIDNIDIVLVYLNEDKAVEAERYFFNILSQLPTTQKVSRRKIATSLEALSKSTPGEGYNLSKQKCSELLRLYKDQLVGNLSNLYLSGKPKKQSTTIDLDNEISHLNKSIDRRYTKITELEHQHKEEYAQRVTKLYEEINKLESERHLKHIERIRQHATNLSPSAKKLGKIIENYTGVIYIIEVVDNSPNIVGTLSATVLKDKAILTSAHSLLPVFKNKKSNRFLFFFIPRSYFAKEGEYTVKRHLLSEIKSKLQENEGKASKTSKEIYKKSMFADEKSVKLADEEENVIFGSQSPNSYSKYLIKILKFPTYERVTRSVYNLGAFITEKSILENRKDDMALCEVTNAQDLPNSPMNLIKFNSSKLEEEIKQLKEKPKRVFVACSIGGQYFFSGGNREIVTQDIELNYTGTISLPIPTAKGCSGGALIIVDENLLDTSLDNPDNIGILGIVYGYEGQLKKEGTGNYCIWTL